MQGVQGAELPHLVVDDQRPHQRNAAVSPDLEPRSIRRRETQFLTLKGNGTFMFAINLFFLPAQPKQSKGAVNWIHHLHSYINCYLLNYLGLFSIRLGST